MCIKVHGFVHVHVGEGLALCNVEFGFGPKYSRLTKQCFGIVSLGKVSVYVCVCDDEKVE